jgi:hypothetical protein
MGSEKYGAVFEFNPDAVISGQQMPALPLCITNRALCA